MPENIPEGSVVITPAEQYQRTAEQFGTISEKLGSIERTLHPVTAQVAEHDAYLNSLREAGLPGSMARVSVLEKFMWVSVGLSLASGIVGVSNLISGLQ